MEIIESAGRAPSFKLYPGICLTTEGKARCSNDARSHKRQIYNVSLAGVN